MVSDPHLWQAEQDGGHTCWECRKFRPLGGKTPEKCREKPPNFEPVTNEKYLKCLRIIRIVAKTLGYAIGVHGSLIRDLDLIAAPWTEEAASAEELVDHICAEIKKELGEGWQVDRKITGKWPALVYKPHGRLGFTILLHDGQWIDLSVMPRRQE